jgi:hypothetical protein
MPVEGTNKIVARRPETPGDTRDHCQALHGHDHDID